MSERDFASRRLHFVGIGGVGMSGLALVAHELGRALGLPVDNSRCSLMNSKAVSDGLTYVVPAKCSARSSRASVRWSYSAR